MAGDSKARSWLEAWWRTLRWRSAARQQRLRRQGDACRSPHARCYGCRGPTQSEAHRPPRMEHAQQEGTGWASMLASRHSWPQHNGIRLPLGPSSNLHLGSHMQPPGTPLDSEGLQHPRHTSAPRISKHQQVARPQEYQHPQSTSLRACAAAGQLQHSQGTQALARP